MVVDDDRRRSLAHTHTRSHQNLIFSSISVLIILQYVINFNCKNLEREDMYFFLLFISYSICHNKRDLIVLAEEGHRGREVVQWKRAIAPEGERGERGREVVQ